MELHICELVNSNFQLHIYHNIIKKAYLAKILLFKVNNRKTRCEICSKLILKTAELRQWRRSRVSIVNVENISHLFLVFLLLSLNK